MKTLRSFLSLFLLLIALAPVRGHYNYTRPNYFWSGHMLALYHFDDNLTGNVGTEFHSQSLYDRPLIVEAPTGGSPLTITTDVYSPPSFPAVLGPRAVQFNGVQDLKTVQSFSEITGDATIEFWVRWPVANADQFTLEVGAEDGPRVIISRVNNNASLDKFGVMGKDGEYRQAATFTDWAEWNEEFESVNSYWWVMAMTIKSAGIEEVGNGEYVYKAGSFAIFFVNNHELGFYDPANNFEFTGKVSLDGLKVSPASKLLVRNSMGGNVKVDDFIFWTEDLSNGGNNFSGLFTDGRGPVLSSVSTWELY